MLYIVYAVGIIVYLFSAMGGMFTNFFDFLTLVYIVVPTLVSLGCAKSYKNFYIALLIAVTGRKFSIYQYKKSLSTVIMVVIECGMTGITYFLIDCITYIKSSYFTSLEDIGGLFVNFSTAGLSLFYPMVIGLILLPLILILKINIERDLKKEQEEEKA